MKINIDPTGNDPELITIRSTDDLGAFLKHRHKRQKRAQSDLAALAGIAVLHRGP